MILIYIYMANLFNYTVLWLIANSWSVKKCFDWLEGEILATENFCTWWYREFQALPQLFTKEIGMTHDNVGWQSKKKKIWLIL